MSEARMPIICIVGPTAVGKTDLSLFVAEALFGEIISADSMQVYRHMDIGTAKLPPSERRGIPHHLIDVVEPNETFTVHDYAVLARQAAIDISNRGHLPIVVGGTGLYIRALIDHFDFTTTARNDVLRVQLEDRAAAFGVELLYRQLREMDPVSAHRIHKNDLRRIIRALEIVLSTGRPVAENYRADPSPFRPIMVGLNADRQELYHRIDRRVDHMMELGLLQEVKNLVEIGCHETHTSMQAIGYKELLGVLQDRLNLEEAVAAIKQASRRYAKRQLSWFRTDSRIVWYERREDDMMSVLCAKVLSQIQGVLQA